MKSYTITVNGNVYDVTVEENGSVSAPAACFPNGDFSDTTAFLNTFFMSSVRK